jgi:hypothetical protein
MRRALTIRGERRRGLRGVHHLVSFGVTRTPRHLGIEPSALPRELPSQTARATNAPNATDLANGVLAPSGLGKSAGRRSRSLCAQLVVT